MIDNTKKSKILLIANVVVLACVLIFSGFTYVSEKTTGQPKEFASYEQLLRSCSDECCESSVRTMQEYAYSVYDGVSGCPISYSPNELRCPTSKKWCQPGETFEGQGVIGRAWLSEGDCMPGPEVSPTCKDTYGERKLFIRKPMTPDDLKGTIGDDSQPYRGKDILLVKEVMTAPDGYFMVYLSPGKYSIFVQDGEEEYCPNWDCNVIIPEGQTTMTRFDAHINKSSF